MDKNEILTKLDKRQLYKALIPSLKVNGKSQSMGLCPFHDDHNPSLSVNIETGLWNCFACGKKGDVFNFYQNFNNVDFPTALKEIAEMQGLTEPKPRVVETFEYKNAEGKVVYIKERIEPGRNGRKKEFFFKHQENGKHLNGKKCSSVLYNLPELISAKNVIFVEGERKADLLMDWGFVATCLDAGANSPWIDEYTKVIQGKETVIILPDNDKPGRECASRIAGNIHGKAKTVKVVELPELADGEDIIDWIKVNGNNKSKLIELIKASPEWLPLNSDDEENINTKPLDYEACYGDVPTLDKSVYTGVFASYIDLLHGCTEAPDEYHYYSLLTVLGLIIGKRVHVFYGRRQYPNFYFVLIGPTGKARKTTAMRHARDLLNDLNTDIKIITGVPSGESLIRSLHGKGVTSFIYQEEISTILKKASQESNTTIQRLTEFYDTPDVIENPTKTEPAKAEDFLLSFISGSTREWLISGLNIRDIHGGFANRFGFVVGKLKKPIPLPEPYNQQLWNSVVKKIHDLGVYLRDTNDCRLEFTDEAKALWVKYYDSLYNKPWPSHEMALLAERLTEKVYKVALVYAVINRSNVIESDHLDLAIKVGEHLEKCIEYLFCNVGQKEYIQKEQKVLTIIQKKGTIEQSRLHQHFGGNMTSSELKKIIEGLVYSDRIKISTEGRRNKKVLIAI